MLDLSTLDSAHFRPYLNEKFEIKFTDEFSLWAELIAVTDWELMRHENESVHVFSLEFKIPLPGQEYPPQAIYHMTHPRHEPLNLFLVPIRREADNAVVYEAMFT
jgi:hypothetical protein